MGKTPKLLGLVTAAVLAIKVSCNDGDTQRVEVRPTATQKAKIEISNQVHEVLDPSESPKALEDEAVRAYQERCLHRQDGKAIDFIKACEHTQSKAVLRINEILEDFQVNERLEDLGPLESCGEFHWADEENRTSYDMLAPPGPHSHFEFGNWDCVTGLEVYTDTKADIVCKLSTVCRDEGGGRHYISGDLDKNCEKKLFHAMKSLDQLDRGLDANFEAAAK